jgi:hypothetical protein
MVEATHLRTVASEGEVVEREVIDLWLCPEDLPDDIAVIPRKLPENRHWLFDPANVLLLPSPVVLVEELVETYRDQPVMGYHQLQWMMNHPKEVIVLFGNTKIYFLGFEFRRQPWQGSVFALQQKDGTLHRTEERFDSKPMKGGGRIIMMR